MDVVYSPSFVRQFKALDPALQEETLEKIALFKERKNHPYLKVHKLHGRLAGRYSFSINYRFRIVFFYRSKQEAIFLAIGDHAVYS